MLNGYVFFKQFLDKWSVNGGKMLNLNGLGKSWNILQDHKLYPKVKQNKDLYHKKI